MSNMSGLHGLTGSLGDLVLNVRAGHLGDGVAVLNLDRDKLDLGVVDTVLGGDGSASMLHCGCHRVGNCGCDWGNGVGKWGSSIGKSSKVLSISLSLSFTLVDTMGKGTITDVVNDLLADLLVFYLLSFDSLFGADILSSGCANLSDQDFLLSHAVGSMIGCNNGSTIRSTQKLGVSFSLGLGGSIGEGKKARNCENLHIE